MNDAVLRRLAGDASYRKGHNYYQQGQVESVEPERDGLRAVVRGTRKYTVTLFANDGVLDYSCDCPEGADDKFCEHCVAAAFAWLNREVAPKKAKRRGKPTPPTLADALKVLQDEDKHRLLELVMEWAADDDRLRDRLLQYAAQRMSPETGIELAKKAFGKAVRVRGFLPYGQAGAWARGVHTAIDNIAELLASGQAAAVVEVCESALDGLVTAAGAVDDSAGHITVLRERLQELHLEACREARPDSVALAGRLFARELHGELDVFDRAAENYAEILGGDGLAEYRRLAKTQWAKVPVRTEKDRFSSGTHFHITRIMESLARVSGNTEKLVAVMSRDLSHPYGYLKIAELYRAAGQHDQALAWAENGVQTFSDVSDPRLRDFIAEEYHRRGRHHDAMRLIWPEFRERPKLETYQTLERHAKAAGNWPEWRERALAEIRESVAKGDRSLLVKIHLYEGDVEAAWRNARAGDSASRLWIELAAALESDHPEEAAAIYVKQAEAEMKAAQNGRYKPAVELLVKAAAVMKRTGKNAEFVSYLEALRAKRKIRTKFIELLDKKSRLLGG
jgi:uncharacterized Zn finger protein